jgi:hypothetical protein
MGDHLDELYCLGWTKNIYAICFLYERAILFMANVSITPPSWGPDGEERTTDITYILLLS